MGVVFVGGLCCCCFGGFLFCLVVVVDVLGCGVVGLVACVVVVLGWVDLVRLLWRCGKDHEVDVLATAGLSGYLSAVSALVSLSASLAVSQLEQICDVLC
ncbi:hypothetical protein RA267_27400, partial [Pseudomonas syringae pv. tagetis]